MIGLPSIKPILFSTPMGQAIMAGNKTTTRRVAATVIRPPKHQAGDVLWVRETHQNVNGHWIYRADMSHEDRVVYERNFKWRPSIYMPKAAARIFLNVTGVRVERLHDKFFQDGSTILAVRDEGIDIGDVCRGCIACYGHPGCRAEFADADDSHISECSHLGASRSRFAALWDDLNLKRGFGWASNPWVYAYTFERADKPAGWPSGG